MTYFCEVNKIHLICFSAVNKGNSTSYQLHQASDVLDKAWKYGEGLILGAVAIIAHMGKQFN